MLVESGPKAFVILSTVWDTQEDAGEFYEAIGSWLAKRYPQASRTDNSPSGYSLTHAGEYHSVKRDGDKVRVMVGVPLAEAAKLKGY